MRICFFTTVLIVLLLPLSAKLEASENFTLQTQVYVYRNSDFRIVKVPGVTTTDESQRVVFTSPAVAQFDEEKLSLDGSRFAWSSGRNPPDRFSLIATPTVPLGPEKPVTLLSTAPVQYLEKRTDGTLQVREITGDSPGAPHCRLTFTMNPSDDADKEVHLACDLDIASVVKREALAGVILDVGKPELAQFREKLDFTLRQEEWSALFFRAPNGPNYSVLVLLKVAGGTGPETSVGTEASEQLKIQAALDKFATGYYRNPRLELVAGAIESFGQSGFVNDRGAVYIGFFAEIFGANPERMGEWQKFIAQQNRPAQNLLKEAVKLSRPKAILISKAHSVRLNDMCWGAFFATGDPAYLHRLIEEVEFIDELSDHDLFWAGVTAMWSLARNGAEHPLIRQTLEAAEAKANARTREIIDDLLKKDPAAIRQQITEILEVRRFHNPNQSGSMSGGPRSWGDWPSVRP